MFLNNDQLRVRAHEFALTNELSESNRSIKRFWPAFRCDMDSLHEFAEQLTSNRVECKQPAEDWLLDHINFLETQAQAVIRELPRKTLKKLPKLTNTGTPRIYALCQDYLEHVDGRFDIQSFEIYLQSYQEVSVLKVTECWMLVNAMRVVIIHFLAEKMLEVRRRNEVCRSIVSLLNRIGESNRSDEQIRILLEREAQKRKFGPIEIVHFVQHLSEWEPNIRIVRDWLSAHVENNEHSLEQLISLEHQLQAELQVTSGNLVQSLHHLERIPWRMTFSKISHVEQILLDDHAGEYSVMDKASCDCLRERIVEMAERLKVPETLVATEAVRLRKSVQNNGGQNEVPPRAASLAYYMFDPHGIQILRSELSKITRPRVLPQAVVKRHPMLTYLSGYILILALFLMIIGRWTTYNFSVGNMSWIAIFAALLLPISEWVITILHEAICKYIRPSILLRYDFSKKLPENARTMVVMPIIWSTIEEVDEVVDRLEVHYLANRQDNIFFGVLADFTDSSVKSDSKDEEIISHAVGRIEALCKEYGKEKFFLFHRSRLYNSVDQIYMGWERKRGKLVEFIELLSGKKETSYTVKLGQTSLLKTIRYIFTTDLDTQLPIGVVSRMTGTIHFPYNRPRLNEQETRVIEGYGVIQPRIGVNYESIQNSRFAVLWGGEPGIDPYAFAISDAYQDLFGSGIFVGKGIFDVSAFQKTLVNRIPDHHVLSHDLLEGGFLRTGLASDIEVVESHPSTFYAYQQRAHRWIRGDWQLIKWIGSSCKNRDNQKQKIDLGGITRLQMIDNLRRSLLAPVLLLVALLGVNVLPGRSWVWETVVLITLFMPFLRAVVLGMTGQGSLKTIGVNLLQNLIQLITLPYTAVISLDAICRTLYRLFVSKRNLLEWVTFAQMNRHSKNGPVFMHELAGIGVILIFAVLTWFSGTPLSRFISIASIVIWLLARPVIQYLNHPPSKGNSLWVDEVRSELFELASSIWSYYDHYVTEEESWLPPDNVQYYPKETIAHRTSPTNIGLYLSSLTAARDLGFVDTETMIKRIESSILTVEKMEKWNGHLLNWYDTRKAEPLFPKYVSTVDSGNFIAYLMVVKQSLIAWRKREKEFQAHLDQLIEKIERIIVQTNFWPLYNPEESLFTLGYHIDTNQKDTTLYDLLASESRQASFVAIALGQIPVSHWFSLGRTMTVAGQHKTLLSWSGTIFEYLMPSLIMKTYQNTIWDSTYQGVISLQKKYADQYNIPFGISESGYYAFDYQLNYQYRAFGVPGLGLDRGLDQNLVIAPYASIMALPFAKKTALSALHMLDEFHAKGEYGYYEAIDFTTERLPRGEKHKVVQSYMAHHQGMSLLTLTNLLADEIIVKRFHADKRVKSANLLLQERIPVKAALIEHPVNANARFEIFDREYERSDRIFTEPAQLPEVNVLSNGSLTSITANNGYGMLKWNGLDVTRWKEDPVIESSGPIVYIHDSFSEETWSITKYPCQSSMDTKTTFRVDKTIYEGEYNDISSKMEITVSPDADAEIRSLRLVNNGSEERVLEVTTFLELAMASPSADSAHPAFSKLFIETSHDSEAQSLLARRRTRESTEQETWAIHTVFVDGKEAGEYEYETDRAAFIGRGSSLQKPKSMVKRLRGLVGSVVDPSFVMRRRIQLAPMESATVSIVTGVANTREKVLAIIDQLREHSQIARTFHLAWVRSQIDLRHMHLTSIQAAAAQHLAGRLLLPSPHTEKRSEAIRKNTLGQSALWQLGISGDVSIAAVSVGNMADLPFVVTLARQHQYLIKHGLELDLVILDETVGGYQDQLMSRLRDLLAMYGIGNLERIIGLKSTQLKENERILLQAAARVFLKAGGPSLIAQLSMNHEDTTSKQAKKALFEQKEVGHKPFLISSRGEFSNGWGGFVDDGNAYEIIVKNSNYLPRPWSNIISNPNFGSLITDFGTGYSWWRNSRECKLTPWSNDPVLDQPGECLYIRDLDAKQLWSATPKPAGGNLTYKVTHGKGFSRFEQQDGDVSHIMEVTVPLDDSLKLIQLTLKNTSKTIKPISLTYYAEWVLGVLRSAQAPFIITEWDQEHCTLLARNAYQDTFREAIGFMHISVPVQSENGRERSFSWTGDRAEFIGGGGTLESPLALSMEHLSNRTGSFFNTCGALQTEVEIPPEDELTVTILFGCASSKEKVFDLVDQYSLPGSFEQTVESVQDYWKRILGQIQVKTPDRSMDIMMNGWLLYQAQSCRIWARTAFYQAGGAIGFRDQLQDSLAFLHADPGVTRRQILINAAHQYQEGDVQHWWHEETHKGIRTKFSDDLLWLPYTVSRYLEQTGDDSVLKEEIPFLHSEVLKDEELERYEDTVVSEETDTLLEHCLRAIRQGLKLGEHGIPLMGIGDWNDGMSRIGAKGRGESVWLGWFLLDILKRFLQLDSGILAKDEAIQYEAAAKKLEENLNRSAWDGAWFRRAFTDSGTWIGSNKNKECSIDAIAQSWSVISQGTSPERQLRAMQSFDRELVDRDLNIARLLTKPFDKTTPSPGYIQGYPPGIRENGGQYTHGVIWGIVAWAMLEKREKAFELFFMLNPINHTKTFRDVQIYENEPYVMSADVYTANPHLGLAGWSWYTGAAGWMYQAGLEYILGIKRQGDQLRIQPCVPRDWDSFLVDYRYKTTMYSIEIFCEEEFSLQETSKWIVDGKDQGSCPYLQLIDDGEVHNVSVYLGVQYSSSFG